MPDCPGWTLRDLVEHLGGVHRWAHEGITTGRAPDRSSTDPAPDAPPREADGLARWFGDGAIALAQVLDAADLDTPAWMPFRVERPTIGVWLRRQTHETSLHRWDAESAVGAPGPIEATSAADGIDEYFDLVLARRVDRDGITLPSHSLHVHCTDTPGEWFVQAAGGHDDRAAASIARAMPCCGARPRTCCSRSGVGRSLMARWRRSVTPMPRRPGWLWAAPSPNGRSVVTSMGISSLLR